MTTKKTIFITGCSSGIGYTTADVLKKRGHRVICSARKAEDVARLIDEGYECLSLDLADSDSIQSAVDQLRVMTDDHVDALFNNGAFGQPGAVEDLSRDVLRQQFETNVFGTHELTNLIIPLMRKQGSGRIIYNSSVLGFVAMKFRGAYNASKFALEGLADTLRLELRGSGIDVVLIEPGRGHELAVRHLLHLSATRHRQGIHQRQQRCRWRLFPALGQTTSPRGGRARRGQAAPVGRQCLRGQCRQHR